MDDTLKVVKSDVCWLEIGLCRGKLGLEIAVKAEPRVEDIIKSMAAGEGTDPLEAYGTEWVSAPGSEIHVYSFTKDVTSMDYTIATIGHGFFDKLGKVNLAFLRFKGISKPEGIRFCVSGPVSRQHARDIGAKIVQASRIFVRDYVVPFNIGLRISSTEI